MNEKKKNIMNYIHEETPSYGDYHADYKKTGGKTEKLIEINSLETPGYVLKKPFCIRILREKDTIVGEIEELELYAFGDNKEEIIDELKMDLIDLYEHYRHIKSEKLGDKPKMWKKILCKKIDET